MATPGRPNPSSILLALQIERAKDIIAEAGTLTISERIELLEQAMNITAEEARELVYRVAGWRT
jgi:hypothetical protein